METFLIKTMSGQMAPMDQDVDAFKRYKAGSVIRCEIKEMRNGPFFRKWWALTKTAFDLWTESTPRQEFRGMEVEPNFDRFRKDITILSGYYTPVFNVKGEVRMEAASLKWSSMTETDFNDLYQKTINTILHKIIPHRKISEEQLRDWANRVMEFA